MGEYAKQLQSAEQQLQVLFDAKDSEVWEGGRWGRKDAERHGGDGDV